MKSRKSSGLRESALFVSSFSVSKPKTSAFVLSHAGGSLRRHLGSSVLGHAAAAQ